MIFLQGEVEERAIVPYNARLEIIPYKANPVYQSAEDREADRIARLHQKLDMMRDEMIKKNTALIELRDAWLSQKADHETTASTQATKIALLESKVIRIKQRLRENNRDLKDHISDLNQQIADISRRCLKRSQAFTILNKEHNDLLARYADLKLKFDKMNQRLLDLSAQNVALKTSIGPRHEKASTKEVKGKGKRLASSQDVDLSELPSPTPKKPHSDEEYDPQQEAKKRRAPPSKRPTTRKA